MKAITKSLLGALLMSSALFSCQSDNVAPTKGAAGKDVAGAIGDVHPLMDSICTWSDQVQFQANDGSLTISKCGWEDGLETPIACTTPQEPWGTMRIGNGYAFETTGNTAWITVDFALPYGWYCWNNTWKFENAGGFGTDPNTGKPTSQGDWMSAAYSPARGEWKIALPMSQMPNVNLFEMACKLTVSPIDVNGLPMSAYSTELWAHKTPTVQGANPFVLQYAPIHCMSTGCPTTQVASVCKTVYKGLPCGTSAPQASALLVADASGAGNSPVYNWSNNTQGSNLSVSPTASTTYSVTISDGTCDIRIMNFDVNVVDVACVATVPANTPILQNVTFAGYAAGQRITNQLSAQGVSSVTATGGIGQAWIFDSNNPTGGDNDLGTPHTSYGGKGVGNGGPASNNTALGNLIIVQENNGAPDDNASGGNINFNFASPRTVNTVRLVDIDGAGNKLRLARSGQSAIFIPIPATGDNGVVNMTINTNNVTQLRVVFTGSGAVAGFTTSTTSCSVTTTPGLKVCDVPPGNPGGAVDVCATYDALSSHIDGVCGSSNSSKTGSYLGTCGSNPCGN